MARRIVSNATTLTDDDANGEVVNASSGGIIVKVPPLTLPFDVQLTAAPGPITLGLAADDTLDGDIQVIRQTCAIVSVREVDGSRTVAVQNLLARAVTI